MLSLKYIRENKEKVIRSAALKNVTVDIDELLRLDTLRRTMIGETESLKAEKNRASQVISEKKRKGETADVEILKMREVSEKIKDLDSRLRSIDSQLLNLQLYVPNIIHSSVPEGKEASDNQFVREWGTPVTQPFPAKDHLELGESLGLFDFKRSSRMSGAGFPLFTGWGARLERSLINFMIDLHVEKHGYRELFPPFLTTRAATTTTGQLPKFEEDMYRVDADDLFLISTAEVPVTNYYKDDILSEDDLPAKFTAYSACFRREAGTYGKETRGLLRVHQFNKIEMVRFVHPDHSYAELEILVTDAEAILQALGLHYRVMALASGDLSFSAAKCYDLEVWAPAYGKFLEVSSCSNFEDFQARRGNIRYRRKSDNQVDFVHTLNGSGLATPRLMIALLETCQQADGSIRIPEVLRSYMKTDFIPAV